MSRETEELEERVKQLELIVLQLSGAIGTMFHAMVEETPESVLRALSVGISNLQDDALKMPSAEKFRILLEGVRKPLH